MLGISRKTYKRNVVQTIVENEEKFWLNEKHMKEVSDHKNLRKNTRKHHSDHRKYR